jgi:manganese transport protein
LAWLSAIIIVSLNGRLVFQQIQDWMNSPDVPQGVIHFVVIPIALLAVVLLFYTTFAPLIQRNRTSSEPVPHGDFKEILKSDLKPTSYQRIAIAVDFSSAVHKTISHALSQGGLSAEYLLIHVVESPGAFLFGKDVSDFEAIRDKQNLEQYAHNLRELGYSVNTALGYGKPKFAIAEKTKSFEADLLVMGAHGHHTLKDLFFGTTISGVRHLVSIPVLIVR